MNKKLSLYLGIAILIIMIVSYFIPVYQTEGYNSLANVQVRSHLLSWFIFSSPLVLGVYIIIAIWLIFYGLRGIKFKIK